MKDFDFFISFFRNRIESSSLAIYPFDANIKKKHLIEKRLSYIVITKDKLLFCGYFGSFDKGIQCMANISRHIEIIINEP